MIIHIETKPNNCYWSLCQQFRGIERRFQTSCRRGRTSFLQTILSDENTRPSSLLPTTQPALPEHLPINESMAVLIYIAVF